MSEFALRLECVIRSQAWWDSFLLSRGYSSSRCSKVLEAHAAQSCHSAQVATYGGCRHSDCRCASILHDPATASIQGFNLLREALNRGAEQPPQQRSAQSAAPTGGHTRPGANRGPVSSPGARKNPIETEASSTRGAARTPHWRAALAGSVLLGLFLGIGARFLTASRASARQTQVSKSLPSSVGGVDDGRAFAEGGNSSGGGVS